MENLIEFMDKVTILNDKIGEYSDTKKGIKYIVPTSYLFARCDYLELTNDEFFITEDAAKKGVTITNTSATEPLVMLKHFSENPDLPMGL